MLSGEVVTHHSDGRDEQATSTDTQEHGAHHRALRTGASSTRTGIYHCHRTSGATYKSPRANHELNEHVQCCTV